MNIICFICTTCRSSSICFLQWGSVILITSAQAARLEGSALDIEKEMDRLYKKAEEKSDFSALSAANGLREKMKENRLKLKETNDQISQKRDEMQF